jgi:hypothetical protein
MLRVSKVVIQGMPILLGISGRWSPPPFAGLSITLCKLCVPWHQSHETSQHQLICVALLGIPGRSLLQGLPTMPVGLGDITAGAAATSNHQPDPAV